MDAEIVVGLLSLAGTALGTTAGIIASSRLTTYRLAQLEKKVDLHNCVIQRTFILEEKMSVANHRLADLENKNNKE